MGRGSGGGRGAEREHCREGREEAFDERHDELLTSGASLKGSSLPFDEAAPGACPSSIHQPKPTQPFSDRGIRFEPELPGPDLDAPSLLGRARLRYSPALRHGDGGG